MAATVPTRETEAERETSKRQQNSWSSKHGDDRRARRMTRKTMGVTMVMTTLAYIPQTLQALRVLALNPKPETPKPLNP